MERRPDPPPLEVDDVRLIAGGTLLWAVALVILLVLEAVGDVRNWWWEMCAAGAALGLVGVRYCRRRKQSLQQRV